ncbi:MAG TPA: ABC transporter substrate-binding protein [Casimicrobiaceae bacterium]|nr:ABC transporter substrate-binding protein [Casimicrobiaceae bacterium]
MKLWRSLLVALGVIVPALLPLATVAQGKLEKPQVSIAVGGKSQFYYLPLTIAERLGYFKDEGLDVEISDFEGGSKALQAVVGGSADVVAGAWENTIDQQPKGLQLQGFVLMGRYPAISVGIAKAKAARYKSPKDLKGMKIGVTAPGSSTNRVVLHLLAQDGLKGDDVSIIGVGTSSGAIAAMRSGSLDAMSNVDPIMTMLEASGDVVIIADTRTAVGTTAVFGSADMPAAALYAPLTFVRKNPNTVQALTNALVRALLWLQKATPDQVAATVPPEYLLGNKALYLASYAKVKDAFSPDGMLDDRGRQNTLTYLAAFNPALKPADINLAQTFDPSHVQKALAKYQK